MSFQAPRGTRDILPADQLKWSWVLSEADNLAKQFNYQRVTIPTFEELGLFTRSIGDGTDIMDKELFLVKGIRSQSDSEAYALRPEGTAGIVRAFIQNGLHTYPQPVKLFSIVNNFRYDRPQKGRYREHVQFDLEYFGDFGPFADAQVILVTWSLLQRLGLRNLTLMLNSLGTQEERQNYIQELKNYLAPHLTELSQASQNRYNTNPLRILDSKEAVDQNILRNAPIILDFLTEASRTHFEQVKSYLETWQVPFEITPFLVRGLDYYSHTAFEWTIKDQNGQQNSLGGGGRYDGLLPKLGGVNIGAVGAGLGLDRIIETMVDQELSFGPLKNIDLYLVSADLEARAKILQLYQELIAKGLWVELNLSKEGFNSQLKAAGKSGANYALIIGQNELNSGHFILKDLQNGTQEELDETAFWQRFS